MIGMIIMIKKGMMIIMMVDLLFDKIVNLQNRERLQYRAQYKVWLPIKIKSFGRALKHGRELFTSASVFTKHTYSRTVLTTKR